MLQTPVLVFLLCIRFPELTHFMTESSCLDQHYHTLDPWKSPSYSQPLLDSHKNEIISTFELSSLHKARCLPGSSMWQWQDISMLTSSPVHGANTLSSSTTWGYAWRLFPVSVLWQKEKKKCSWPSVSYSWVYGNWRLPPRLEVNLHFSREV